MKKEFTNIHFKEKSLPEQYFNNMQNEVFEKIKAQSSNNLPEKPLENIHYLLPENYLAKNIANVTKQIQAKPQMKLSIQNNWKYAAVACLFIAAGIFLFNNNNTQSKDYLSKINNVHTEDLVVFVEDNLYDIETDEFVEFYDEKSENLMMNEDWIELDSTELNQIL